MLRYTLALLALALFMLPIAAAHTTVATTDGKYLVTVGNLNEPVTTYTKTGLDLVIRANDTGRAGITGAHLTLTATLLAPTGDELSQTLVAQFGRPGAYTFEDPYYLTAPGEYYLRLNGTINQTSANFDRILVGSGPIPAMEELGFPDEIHTEKQLLARIAALEARLAAVESDKPEPDHGGSAPGFDPLAVLLALGAVGAFVARRR